ncbi:MAG: hypothetical protein C0614_02780 [Desulfuromonas sp.]|nr:MAG: hypothetical protein C0614_02780 [Desulfuromonas sp.]
MTAQSTVSPLLKGLDKSAFHIGSLDDEVRVDKLCTDLLKHLLQHLTKQNGLEPERAGELCHGADYFLREFIIGDRQANIFLVDADQVRQFAGHWYIIRTLEPNRAELGDILDGVATCYAFLNKQRLVSDQKAAEVAKACNDLDYYAARIESFWAIENGGFDRWRAECPLDEPGPA